MRAMRRVLGIAPWYLDSTDFGCDVRRQLDYRQTMILRAVLRVIFTSIAFGLGACANPPPPPPVEQAPPPPPTKKPEPVDVVTATSDDRRCQADNECVLTTVDCCGCQSLGQQTGVRRDHLASLADRRRPVCTQAFCPMAMSIDPTCSAMKALCRGGICVPDVGLAAPPPGVGVEPIR